MSENYFTVTMRVTDQEKFERVKTHLLGVFVGDIEDAYKITAMSRSMDITKLFDVTQAAKEDDLEEVKRILEMDDEQYIMQYEQKLAEQQREQPPLC